MSVVRNLVILTGAGAIAVGVGWYVGSRPTEALTISFLAVGQGDCSVLQDGNSAILIDAGPTDSAARFTIVPTLRTMGVDHVEAILLSHPDEDHIAGVGVLRQRFPDARVVMSSGFRENRDFLAHLADWGMTPAQIDWMPERAHWRFGQYQLDIYCPPVRRGTPDNDGSMIVKAVTDSYSATFSGDASAAEEREAAPLGDWSADLMHVGHHGSKTSTSLTWLGEVRPKVAVISCGQFNRYGHPHDEVLARLQDAHIVIRRTDESGTITVKIRE